MNFLKSCGDVIKKNCSNNLDNDGSLEYWRNQLFASTIIYILLFCIIGLIPSIYWSLHTNIAAIVIVDLMALSVIIIIAFAPRISVQARKLIFIVTVYLLSIIITCYVGLVGSGILFLQMACIFSIIIFPKKYAFTASYINTIICLIFCVLIFINVLPWSKNQQESLGTWIAVSSNLIFLSFLCSALIPKLFLGLEETILKEKEAVFLLQQKQDSLKNVVQQLENKNEEIEQFAYIASHDLQEPLRMISSFMTLLQKKYNNIIDEKGKTYIHYAIDGAHRMKLIMLDLLDFSKIGKTDEKLELIDINEVLKETKLLLKRKILQKNAIIESGVFPLIKSYKTPIKQVLNNLIDNALKYSSENKPSVIKVSLTKDEFFWQFEISDNGIGIKKEYFETIFIIFKRLHSSSDYEGTGMGLAICKKIIENLGGKIWLISEIDVGTTFYFTIRK